MVIYRSIKLQAEDLHQGDGRHNVWDVVAHQQLSMFFPLHWPVAQVVVILWICTPEV